MGLQVNGPPPGEEYTYTPDVLGNAELAEPTRVRLRYPTEATKRRAGRKFAFAMQLDADGLPVQREDGSYVFDADSANVEEVNLDLLEACVVAVENYTDAAGRPIATGRELWEHGHVEVVTDVVAEIQSGHALSAQKKSASERPSGSLKATTDPSGGTAESVAALDSTSHEDAAPALSATG